LISLRSCGSKYFVFSFLSNPDVEIKFLCCLLKDENLQQYYKAVADEKYFWKDYVQK